MHESEISVRRTTEVTVIGLRWKSEMAGLSQYRAFNSIPDWNKGLQTPVGPCQG